MIYLIAGAPCSGKSTYVRARALIDDMIYDFDAIIEAISIGSHEIRPLWAFDVLPVIRAAIDNADTTGDKWIISSASKAIDKADYVGKAAIITIDPGIDACKARAMADQRREDKTLWLNLIDTWYDTYQSVEGESRIRAGDDA